MQPNGQDPTQGIPPYPQSYTPFTPEQMQQWQQYGIPQEQFTPEVMQYMQQQGMYEQQVTPEMLEQYQMYQMQMHQQMASFQGTSTQQSRQAGTRRGSRGARKEGGGAGRFFRALIILAVLGGGAWFLLGNQEAGGPATAVIETGTLGTIYRGDALIVRNETAFEDEGVQSIQYVAQEGSVVYPGNVVCYVYSTGYSTKEMLTLQDYRDQIKNYQRTLMKGQAQLDTKMDRLEEEVVQRGVEVRNLVQGARGNLINQETILERAITQRQNYFRSKNSSNMQLNRLFSEEETQKQRIDSWIKQRHATRQSIVSFYSDGFEQALNLSDFEKYTPTEVRSMINGERPEVSTASRGRTNIFRLVREEDYAVLMLVKDNNWNPVEGSEHKLKLEQFSNTVVNAKILSFTRTGGELLVRLAVKGDVEPVLYMRACQAELGEYVDCMIVPSGAIYEQGGSKGVVTVNGEKQLFVPVNVVRESGGKAYISAIQMGVLSAGQTVRLFR